ncbi:hypothetical protein FQR65_LT18639 [Abscondita terminalis]|nr:hypothetical protein FQR65_LT18639 [Abscondita terminalis]
MTQQLPGGFHESPSQVVWAEDFVKPPECAPSAVAASTSCGLQRRHDPECTITIPLSIPAPYNHSNIDSDEVLFYAEGDFMSRNHIDLCDFTLHPGGIVHGPHPGAMERSIGQKETHEYAVMVDPFRPLKFNRRGAESRRPYL